MLVVSIISFSYKRGLPVDVSGNGGGYVFDCRWVHNPGRYAEYRAKTGLDIEVSEFLESDGEIGIFLDGVYRLIDPCVSRYIERGFSSLQVCFGCTGGQHRSVYSAERLCEHLRSCFSGSDIEVRVEHRELVRLGLEGVLCVE